MKFSQAKEGRTFVIRLQDGEIIHEKIEMFAKEQGIQAATLVALGGADKGSVLITGPRVGRPDHRHNYGGSSSGSPAEETDNSGKVEPMETVLEETHEITGTGTIFPDKKGNPVLHMHIAAGRDGNTITGCVRRGVRTWHVLEFVLRELIDTKARRLPDATTGFELLEP